MSERFWDITPWKDLDFSEVVLIETFESLIDNPEAVIFRHEQGVIGGDITTIYTGDDRIAVEKFWFADSHGKELLECFEDWAKDMGAKKVLISSLAFGNKRDGIMTKLYQKLGYNPIEIHFAKSVDLSDTTEVS